MSRFLLVSRMFGLGCRVEQKIEVSGYLNEQLEHAAFWLAENVELPKRITYDLPDMPDLPSFDPSNVRLVIARKSRSLALSR